jgi:hypothetical protein
LFVAIYCQHSYWPVLGGDPFSYCGGFEGPPACAGGRLSLPTHFNSAEGAAQQAASKCTPLPHSAETPKHVSIVACTLFSLLCSVTHVI